MRTVLTGTASARIQVFGEGCIQAGESELREDNRRWRMAEGDQAHVVRPEGLQQALIAYLEIWEWLGTLPSESLSTPFQTVSCPNYRKFAPGLE